MGHDLNITPQSEGDDEGLNLELSLASPSSSPHDHKPKRSKSVKHSSPLQLMSLPSDPLQLSSSQQEPLQPCPSRQGSPQVNQRQCKRRALDISTVPPSLCNSLTNHHEPATTKDRRQRTTADDREINPPYPWSTNRLAKIHTMQYLRSNNIVTIRGEVECNQCKGKYEMEYDLVSKFEEIARFIARIGEDCNDRAPSSWSTPVPLNCRMCNQQNCVEAVIPKSDFETINWLFLFLGQMLGNLHHEQLKKFCTNTNNHRTGAKDRLLYLTYITLYKQLNG